MQKSNLTKGQRLGAFLRKNAYYIFLAVTIVVVATTIALVAANHNSKPKGPVIETEAPKVTYGLPLAEARLQKGFSATALQKNSTLGWWEAHKAVDFAAPAGTNVLCVFDGKVVSISSNLLFATTVVVEHADGVRSYYSYLKSDVRVNAGQTVKKGDILGQVIKAMGSEAKDGDHLHFEMTKNGIRVDPAIFLDLGDK